MNKDESFIVRLMSIEKNIMKVKAEAQDFSQVDELRMKLLRSKIFKKVTPKGTKKKNIISGEGVEFNLTVEW